MHVKVRVMSGSSAGKELLIRGKRFLIGRAEECNLRPQSDTISRRHCVIEFSDKSASIRDLGSRNGTIVNNVRIEEATTLKEGDELRIGKLHFMVLEAPQPAPVAASPAQPSSVSDDSSVSDSGIISDWLDEANEAAKLDETSDDSDTRQYRMDDTDRVLLEQASQETVTDPNSETKTDKDAKGKSKKVPGQLPKPPETSAKDTQEAAAEMLRKFFKRG